MKKWAALGLIGLFLPVIAVVLFLFTLTAGGAGSISSPLIAFATPDQAYWYQYIASELGIPWDVIMLADGIHAYETGEADIEEYNPLLTALQFCILEEKEYVAVIIELESEEDLPAAGQLPADQTQDNQDQMPGTTPIPQPEPEIEWVLNDTKLYTGLDEILEYIKTDAENLKYTYKEVDALITAINKVAEEKSKMDPDYRYEVTLLNNPDYKKVLRELIVLSEKNIDYVMQVYESKYLCLLYGYDSADFTQQDIELPELVVGNVTREQLAQVAVSILNHPYWLGGKSSHMGPPGGPLDCSGYVDWVYMQCFGVTVGNGGGGAIPNGIAVSGTGIQWYACDPIDKSELQIGDLGFLRDPAEVKSGQYNHVGIYLGSANGQDYWIHCGGSSYGTEASPTGRVGISVSSGSNSYNPVDGTSFAPAMKSVKFNYFRRPRFQFIE